MLVNNAKMFCNHIVDTTNKKQRKSKDQVWIVEDCWLTERCSRLYSVFSTRYNRNVSAFPCWLHGVHATIKHIYLCVRMTKLATFAFLSSLSSKRTLNEKHFSYGHNCSIISMSDSNVVDANLGAKSAIY